MNNPLRPSHDDSLELWFTKIFNEINEMRARINIKEGFLIFKSHVHTQDELLSFPSFHKIDSFLGTISDIVGRWQSENNFSEERAKYYSDTRLDVERRLSALKVEILARKPTFWEGFINALERFMRYVAKHLPALPQYILERFGLLPSPAVQARIQQHKDIDDWLDSSYEKS